MSKGTAFRALRLLFPPFLIVSLFFPASAKAGDGAWTFLPGQTLFSPILADPREPLIGATPLLSEKGYEDAVGGTLEILRWRSSPHTQWGWGVFAGLWTLCQYPDLTGLEAYDWYSGSYLTEKTGDLSFRLEFQDQKGDLGDALEGVQPNFVIFTRDNFNLTASLDLPPQLRLYGGGGYKVWWDDFDRGYSQVFLYTGFEAYSGPISFLGPACRGYGAYFFKYQDLARGGTYDHSAQLGLQWGRGPWTGGGLRLALVYYNGRSEFGTFYTDYDHHWGLSLYFDP